MYSFGITVFIVLFILEKGFGVFSSILNKLCCCLKKSTGRATFSNDIFKELSNEMQQKEYNQTKIQLRKVDIALNEILLKERTVDTVNK